MSAPTVLPALDEALVALARAWVDSPERDTWDAVVDATWEAITSRRSGTAANRLGRLLIGVAWSHADDLALRLEDVDRFSRALDAYRTDGEHRCCCDDDCPVCEGGRACERCEAFHADWLAAALLQLRHLLGQGRGREELDALDALAGAA